MVVNMKFIQSRKIDYFPHADMEIHPGNGSNSNDCGPARLITNLLCFLGQILGPLESSMFL